MREALLAYEEKLRSDARKDFERDVMLYTLRAPWTKKGSDNKPPKLPEILRD